MKILVTGATGNLGKSLIPELIKKHQIAVIIKEDNVAENFSKKFPLIKVYKGDITDSKFLKKSILEYNPECILHAAAITNAEFCENNKEVAWKVNVNATKNLLDISLSNNPNIYFVYISTSGVFDCGGGGYDEDSIPNPQNYYCLTKLEGENAIKKSKNVCIIRTSFVSREKWPYKKAFIDRYGTYLFTTGVAKGIMDVIEKKPKGVIHLTGNKKISMFDLAKITTPEIEPTTLKEYKGPKLPRDMSLRSKRWKTYSLED